MADNVYKPRVRHIQPGEAVSAEVAGRPNRDLEARQNYLKSRLDAAELGRILVDPDAPIASDVLIGEAVFYNSTTQRYERALAAVENDSNLGTLVWKESAAVLGIVQAKDSSDIGDIILFGVASVDITGALAAGETLQAGYYYLSAAEPGKLTSVRPVVPVVVLYADGQGKVYVQPRQRDFLEDHIHFSFEIDWRPAGTVTPPTTDDEAQVIDNPDENLPGWLPANHSIFNGNAPADAVYGYNLSQHPELQKVWPPIPIEAVSLEWHRTDVWAVFGESHSDPNAISMPVGRVGIPLGDNGLAKIDKYGIWWLKNTRNAAPWPPTILGSGTGTPSSTTIHRPVGDVVNTFDGSWGNLDEDVTTADASGDGLLSRPVNPSLANIHVMKMSGAGSLVGIAPTAVRGYILAKIISAPLGAKINLAVSLVDDNGAVLIESANVAPQIGTSSFLWASFAAVKTYREISTNPKLELSITTDPDVDVEIDAAYAELDLNLTSSSSSSSASSSSASAGALSYPSDLHRILLNFSRAVFATDKTVVTSLKPAENSPILVTNCEGDVATTGDLELGLNLNFLVDPDDKEGSTALKSFDGSSFTQGTVTEGLKPGANVVLSSDKSRTDSNGDLVYQGIVTIEAAVDPGNREILPQIVVLGDAQERVDSEVPYIGFPAGFDSQINVRFNVPVDGLPNSPKMKMRVVLTGDLTGTLPPLTLSYRKLPRANITEKPLTVSENSITFNSNVSITSDYYVEVESDAFDVDPGDLIIVELARTTNDGYGGEVGMVRMTGVIFAG